MIVYLIHLIRFYNGGLFKKQNISHLVDNQLSHTSASLLINYLELLTLSAELIFFTAELSLFLERSFDFSAGAPFVEMPPRKWAYFWRFRTFCSIFRKKDRKLIFHHFSLFFDILDMSTQIFMIIIDWYLFIFIYKQFH